MQPGDIPGRWAQDGFENPSYDAAYRPVKVNAHYPGLTASNTEKLRIYHLADKALEDIFQKVSRLNLDMPARARSLVIRGWEAEWARFCPSFREALAAEAGARSPRKAAAAEGGTASPPAAAESGK